MLELFFAELKRSWIEFIRYPLEAIATIAVSTFVFYGLFLSAQFIAGPNLHLGDRLDTIVVGYVLWSLVLSIINDIASGLQMEAQTGTLEQVLLSPFPTSTVFLIRALTSLALRLTLMLGLLLIIIGFTGVQLNFSFSLLFPLFTLLLSAYGLAFFMGAIALVFKRVQHTLGLFQFTFLFLLAVPSDTWLPPFHHLAFFLPMTPGVDGLRHLMIQHQSIQPLQITLACLNGIIYFAIGLRVFQWAEHQAKLRGLLSGY